MRLMGLWRWLRRGEGSAAAIARSDEDLFAAYVGGDAEAFEALFHRYAGPLLGLMRQQVRQPELARELVQQTFLQLHRARYDFRVGARVRPWLYTIALNLRREHFRRRGRRPEEPRVLAEHEVPTTAPVDLVQGETAAAVRAALAQLPETQRVVIQMHWFDGIAFPEVAQITGVSLSAVKVRAHRGYQRLRQILAEPVTDRSTGA